MAQQYQVLARKWRPQQFDDVVGQEHVTTTLKNAIEQNRLAHAYLFVGPRGIGKTSTARIFAKALNCVKGPTVTPCDKCDNCKEIAEGRSLDVLEIDGASNRGIDEVRELRETVKYAPARGKFKIYIIDEVHMLTKEAFNALLKTLEEPPPHVKFLFATTEPQKVLPTILSRCQRFDLRRIPSSLIVEHLKSIAKKEKVSIDDAALAAIARGAEGGLRDAESALDQLIAFCGNKIAESDVLSVFGLVAHDQIARLTDAVIDGETIKALQVLKKLDDVGKDLQRLTADMLDHFRNLLVVTLGEEGTESLQLPETEIDLLKAQAKRTDSDAVLRIIDALSAAEGRLRYALSKRVFLEIALVKAVKAREMMGIDGVLKKLNELKGQVVIGASATSLPVVSEARAGTTEVSKPAPAAPQPQRPAETAPSVAAAGAASLEDAWAYAVEHLGKVTPLTRSYLVGTRPLGMQGNVLVIGFDQEFADRREFADRPRNIEVLQAKLKEKLRMDVALKFEVIRSATPPPAKAAASGKGADPSKKGLEEFKNDPLIKKALEIFKGTIVEVRK
ncbi:MAG TPA: DNA polymerase III subunit gamma/tau [Verrucomicrobiae bacterium]|nr:DNA polymerase III subunit gamma/tau [Verrucomicrobiae bacterium]